MAKNAVKDVVEAMEGTIHIDGLRIYAHHGVNPQETVVGNVFEVNLALKIDAEAAMKNDSLGDTVNYAEIVDLVKKCMAEPSLLLENAAYRICHAISDSYPAVRHGSISLYKIQPPISAELARVGFSFDW